MLSGPVVRRVRGRLGRGVARAVRGGRAAGAGGGHAQHGGGAGRGRRGARSGGGRRRGARLPAAGAAEVACRTIRPRAARRRRRRLGGLRGALGRSSGAYIFNPLLFSIYRLSPYHIIHSTPVKQSNVYLYNAVRALRGRQRVARTVGANAGGAARRAGAGVRGATCHVRAGAAGLPGAGAGGRTHVARRARPAPAPQRSAPHLAPSPLPLALPAHTR